MYETLLGKARWDALPAALRALHSPGRARGRLEVRRGAGVGARLLGWLCRFPAAGRDVDLALAVSNRGAGQRWERRIGASHVATDQQIVDRGLMDERFGPFVLTLDVRASRACLELVQRRAALAAGPLRVRLPAWLAPRVHGRACATRTAVRIDVQVSAPLAGLVLAYDGIVEPEATPRATAGARREVAADVHG